MELSLSQCATLACLLEVTAPKAGNVHRGADFEDVTFPDFVLSAVVSGPIIADAGNRGVGRAVLDAIRATRAVVSTNTNLGTVLLLAALAAVPRGVPLRDGVRDVLRGLSRDDAAHVYEAIRVAKPGGLGSVELFDVAREPPADLLAAMRAAADRDLVARQYANGFDEVLSFVAPKLRATRAQCGNWSAAIIHVQLEVLARLPDSLIERKRGRDVARRASEMAAAVLAAGEPGSEEYLRAYSDLDFWLRCDGHARNPGTTADLIAAGLFAVLRDDGLER